MKIQALLGLFSPEDLEDTIHIITVNCSKGPQCCDENVIKHLSCPRYPSDVREQGITVHDIATNIQANASSIPPLDIGA